jgi:hypothetical protein
MAGKLLLISVATCSSFANAQQKTADGPTSAKPQYFCDIAAMHARVSIDVRAANYRTCMKRTHGPEYDKQIEETIKAQREYEKTHPG